MRIAFAASRNLSIEIIEWIYNNKTKFNIKLVGGVAPKFKGWWDDKVAETYKNLHVPIYSSIEEMIDDSKPEIVFSLNYWKIISSEYISKVDKGIINIHHSYKLRFRGRYSTSWAIIHARKDNNWFHGTTLHYVDSKLDNGSIIDSQSCEINESDTAEILFERVEELAIDMFKNNFNKILSGEQNFIDPDSEFFYYGKDSNENLQVNYNSPIEEVYDFVRAWSFKDRPKPYFLFNGRKIILDLNQENR